LVRQLTTAGFLAEMQVQPPVKFLQQLKDYSENDLVLKIVMIYLLFV